MAEEDKASKTLPATSHKRTKAREKGNMPRAQEFPSYMVLSAMIVLMSFFGVNGVQYLAGFVKYSLFNLYDHRMNQITIIERFSESIVNGGMVLAPVFITLIVLAIFFSLIFQGGWNVSWQSFSFRMDKFNPAKGLKRLMGSANSYMQLGKAFAMVAGLAVYTYFTLSSLFESLPGLQMMPLDMALSYTMGFVFETLFKFVILLIILALIDLFWSKYQYEEQLKMSVKERKDETKNIEGDPQIKRRIRSAQYQAHRRRMMAAVPKADVVVTNPVHYAIALEYNVEKALAPRVVAKGQGYIAEKIKQIAEENEVPIVANPPLAQTLYKTVEVEEMIPPDLYKAVAKVLAYVYKLRDKVPA